MTWTKTKASVAMAVCAASVLIALGTLLLTSKQIAILRAENQKLQAEIAEGRQSAAEPPASALALTPELDRLKHDAAEVLRLRGEVASLRRDRSDLAKLTEENARLRQRLLAAANETKEDAERLTPEQEAAKQVGIAKLNFTRDWLAAFRAYAAANQGQIPTDFNQARSFLPQTFNSTMDPNQFEIVYRGSLQQLQASKTHKLPDIIMLREREPIVGLDGKRSKAYAFADGHSEVRLEPAEGFDEWEKSRIFTGK